MEMPRFLMADDGQNSFKVFWVGCALPLGMILFNLIGFFYLGFPQINFRHPITIQLSREFPTITLMLYFPVVVSCIWSVHRSL